MTTPDAISPRGALRYDASRHERLIVFVIAAVVLLTAILTVTPWPVGAFQDDAIYTVLAKSLATGEGYRFINLPGSPNATHYPPGYPLFLAALWRLFPSFPENVVVFKFANAFFLAAAAVGTYFFVRRRLAFSVAGAVACALAGTLSIVVLLITGVVLSEPMFLALLLPGLLLAESAVDSGDPRKAAAAGLLLGALAMVRTLGAFAIPVACLLLAGRRQWRAAIVLGLSAALFLVPWQLWIAAYQGEVPNVFAGKYGSYGSWLAEGYRAGGWTFAREVLIRNLQDLDGTFSYMLMPVQARWPRGIVFVAVILFSLAGTKRFWRNAPVTLGFLASYILVVMLWPFEPTRFMLAIWPLWLPLVACGVAECWRVGLPRIPRIAWRVAVGLSALAMAAGYAQYNVLGYSRKSWTAAQRDAGQRAKPIAEWVARNTAPTDVLSTEDDLIVYLYTGRRAVPTSAFTALERSRRLSDAEDARNVKEIFDIYHPAFFIIGGAQGVRTAAAFAAESPPLLRLLGHTPHVLIYKRLPQ